MSEKSVGYVGFRIGYEGNFRVQKSGLYLSKLHVTNWARTERIA